MPMTVPHFSPSTPVHCPTATPFFSGPCQSAHFAIPIAGCQVSWTSFLLGFDIFSLISTQCSLLALNAIKWEKAQYKMRYFFVPNLFTFLVLNMQIWLQSYRLVWITFIFRLRFQYAKNFSFLRYIIDFITGSSRLKMNIFCWTKNKINNMLVMQVFCFIIHSKAI